MMKKCDVHLHTKIADFSIQISRLSIILNFKRKKENLKKN